MDTGLPQADARSDFERERRRRAIARIAARLRLEPDDVSEMLPFDEVVAAHGRRSEHHVGLQTIPVDSVVGSVDRKAEFDRAFRPSAAVRARWERIAAARRRGESMPPIDVYRIGDVHFVRDGHHRVSVARALGDSTIEANVTEVRTVLDAPSADMRASELPLKAHERVFWERVPLPVPVRHRIQLSDEWRFAQLGQLVEAWGYRASQDRGGLLSREALAIIWFREEFEPVVELLNSENLGGEGTDAERYLRIATLRYLVLRTHEWSDEVVERLMGEVRHPAKDADTMVHQIIKEIR